MYYLQCKNEILDVTFNANEFIPLSLTKYEELEICENKVISVCEAARMQSMSTVTGVYCNCKSECKNNNCKCKRSVEPTHKGLIRARDGHILSLDSSGLLQFKWDVMNDSPTMFEISKNGELLDYKGDRVYWIQKGDGPKEKKAVEPENGETGKYLTIKLEDLTLKDQASALSEFIITKDI
ncbi:16335_t:CDS:2 [Cetraspora pellucida]|uniref:16335_t:CDS:1 n=1 Tax=Cetraspora pellucida TaxID=1433469 RepID=A0A9N9BKQ1_9GLOM|nr:16335_t:CDS:2 [Cetraspora pellucida]